MTRLFPVLLVLPFLSLLPQTLRAESEVYGGFGIGYSTFSIDELDFEPDGMRDRPIEARGHRRRHEVGRGGSAVDVEENDLKTVRLVFEPQEARSGLVTPGGTDIEHQPGLQDVDPAWQVISEAA